MVIFFGLLHTHDIRNGKELVNRSNCSTAGDLFCDTPADPQLSRFTVNGSCTYTGTVTDLIGDAYSPNTHNFMSYSRKSCRDEFSSEQMDEMSTWADATQRQPFINTTILNGVILSNRTITADIVIIDNVTITNNSDVIIDVCELVTIEEDFQVEAGSTLEIR